MPNRAETQATLQAFHSRLACAQVADRALGTAYLDALRAYAHQVAQYFEEIDLWTIGEFEEVREYVNNNCQWILHAEVAVEILAAAHTILTGHRPQGGSS
jgi:hypothetical protein